MLQQKSDLHQPTSKIEMLVTPDDGEQTLPLSDENDPEISPGLFQGDIAFDNKMFNYFRVGLRPDKFPHRLWPRGVIPYLISELYEPEEQLTIRQAIGAINSMTCVKFVPWNHVDEDFLLIWPTKFPKGCWSYIGRVGGAQILSLQPPDMNGANCFGSEGRAMHELLHALGIYHEQSRSDRDRFVKVHWTNIIPQFKSNFDKLQLENTTYTFEYDYESIMHYGKNYFSKDKGKSTLTPKAAGIKIGQRKMLSKTDCLKVNDLYGCLENQKLYKKFYTRCRILGI